MMKLAAESEKRSMGVLEKPARVNPECDRDSKKDSWGERDDAKS